MQEHLTDEQLRQIEAYEAECPRGVYWIPFEFGFSPLSDAQTSLERQPPAIAEMLSEVKIGSIYERQMFEIVSGAPCGAAFVAEVEGRDKTFVSMLVSTSLEDGKPVTYCYGPAVPTIVTADTPDEAIDLAYEQWEADGLLEWMYGGEADPEAA
ncbi:hypothetical protein DEM27_22205 [Metarhizobium album]|uniref:Uncharacterized protein n=1 Tax=Metarhizobium album TaxID=2182425 RepID=A0A2U2DL66_9HYPH|nr:hypothetical protein [Rhizobium album]PWE54033.1 hypothetical protein DEM27_22205 [Rhizobium album]